MEATMAPPLGPAMSIPGWNPPQRGPYSDVTTPEMGQMNPDADGLAAADFGAGALAAAAGATVVTGAPAGGIGGCDVMRAWMAASWAASWRLSSVRAAMRFCISSWADWAAFCDVTRVVSWADSALVRSAA